MLVCLQAALRQQWRDAEQKKWRGRKPVHSPSAVATAAAAEATASSSSSSSSSLTETPIGNQFPSPLTTAERDRMQEQQRQREVEAARRDSAALLGWASEVASRSGSIVDSFVYTGQEVGWKPKPMWLPKKTDGHGSGPLGGPRLTQRRF